MPVSDGISVAALRSFYEQHVKGTMKSDCTTADILNLVKSLTKGDGGAGNSTSYCQLLKKTASHNEVGRATVFISHAWKYEFLKFLLALEAKFKDNRNKERLWIDNFCHNQHEELTSDEWITQFEQHIVRIGRTVMIVFPWENPIPFTRRIQPCFTI